MPEDTGTAAQGVKKCGWQERQWLRAPAVACAQQGSVRARSCRASWLVQAVAVATVAALVTQGYARGGRN